MKENLTSGLSLNHCLGTTKYYNNAYRHGIFNRIIKCKDDHYILYDTGVYVDHNVHNIWKSVGSPTYLLKVTIEVYIKNLLVNIDHVKILECIYKHIIHMYKMNVFIYVNLYVCMIPITYIV